MKFIHVGDTHIGSVYKNLKRNEDVRAVFKQVIDAAINNKVDFIVHSGDLFNEGNPSLDSLLFVTDQLNKLKLAGIKVFIVPGSHDVGMGESDSIIELFDRNGLLVNLSSKRYILDERDFKLMGETYRNAFLCGVKGKRSRVEEEIFKRLKISIDKNTWVKIFIFHHTVSALGEQFKDLDTESLPKGFDYYAAGHWHGHKDNIQYDTGIIQYPGSTEYCDEKEIVDNPNRGYYLIDYDEHGIQKIDYVVLNTRKKEILLVKANNKSVKEIEDEVRAGLSKNEGNLLVIKIEGTTGGKLDEFNFGALKTEALSLGYSFVSINISKLSSSDKETVEITESDLGKIETEFLNKRGYGEKEVKLAKMLIDSTLEGFEPDIIKKHAEELFGI
jgi:DNA repair exonuclease SbcCD nuclease subunit